MRSQYLLSLTQATILQALETGDELSALEIAVQARLLPTHVNPALAMLQQMGLVTTRSLTTETTSQQLMTLTPEGRSVARALAQYRGAPPVGAIVPLASGSMLSGLFAPAPIVGSGTPHILVGPDKD